MSSNSDYLIGLLKNCSSWYTSTPQLKEFGKGVLVATIKMRRFHTECNFVEAVEWVKEFLPSDLDPDCVPRAYKGFFGMGVNE